MPFSSFPLEQFFNNLDNVSWHYQRTPYHSNKLTNIRRTTLHCAKFIIPEAGKSYYLWPEFWPTIREKKMGQNGTVFQGMNRGQKLNWLFWFTCLYENMLAIFCQNEIRKIRVMNMTESFFSDWCSVILNFSGGYTVMRGWLVSVRNGLILLKAENRGKISSHNQNIWWERSG